MTTSEVPETVPPAGPAPKPLKRSLFNKPAWAKTKETQPLTSTTDLFHRSNYINIAQEEEERRKRKAAKKLLQETADQDTTNSREKRRRISRDSDSEDDNDHESSEDDEGGVDLTSNKSETHGRSKSETPQPLKAVTSLQSPAKQFDKISVRAIPKLSPIPPTSNIIDLDGDSQVSVNNFRTEDEDLEITAVVNTKVPLYNDLPDSDDEFAELARKAREKARKNHPEPDSAVKSKPELPLGSSYDTSQDTYQPVRQPSAPPAPEPVVAVLITSTIPGTGPLIVKRRLSQRLKDVRTVWCSRQGYTAEQTKNTILTWRGKRLFDVTSCKSLGIGVDSAGNIVLRGEKDVFGDENRQVHFEAMTEEMFENSKRAKERGEREEEIQAVAPEPQKEESEGLRIILKAKEYEEVKVNVKPVSHFGTPVYRIGCAND
jgi:hypothetical protein